MTTTTEAIQKLVAEWEDAMRNIPVLHAIYPDYTSPLIKQSGNVRVLGFGRWGLPSLKDPVTDKPNRGTTNIRHPWFDDWKGYLGVEHRCLVPLTRFAEPTKLDDGASGNAWFAMDETEPLIFFAGLWTDWHGTRRKDEGPMHHKPFAFFTTKPNDVVGAIHEKAMPVILATEDERRSGCEGLGPRPRHYRGRCPTASSKSLPGCRSSTSPVSPRYPIRAIRSDCRLEMAKSKRPLLIIDGDSLAHRAYHGLPKTAPNSFPTIRADGSSMTTLSSS